MENQLKYYAETGKYRDRFDEALPKLMPSYSNFRQEVYREGALNQKTKRLIALACVAVRMCEDCVYPQAKVAKNYGATREEIIEALNIAVLTGGVPTWSTAKYGITQLFEEWDEEDLERAEQKPAPKKRAAPKKKK